MSKTLNITIVQLNPIVGDIGGNLALARDALETARSEHADLVVFSELFLMGYPPEDLVRKPAAVKSAMEALQELAESLGEDDPAIVIGAPYRTRTGVRNSAFVLEKGEIKQRFDKVELPNYGVFDDYRVFEAGSVGEHCFEFRGLKIGVAICEDIWLDSVPEAIKSDGADLLLALNASPWRRDITHQRRAAFKSWEDESLPYLWVNQCGGQDELVFDGASYAWSAQAGCEYLLGDFETGVRTISFDADNKVFDFDPASSPSTALEADYKAAVLALGDYVRKNRFPGVLLGMSGGVDSALTAAIAVDALGPDNVWCVMLPSKYTSGHSLEDAKACAELLGVRYDSLSIAPGVQALAEMTGPMFDGLAPDTTEENIQSRLRGVALMALSNKFGHMVVTTGNKSEMAVGYATIYGDMCGGYNPLKDFYKTEVFQLCRWRNQSDASGLLGPEGRVIPERIITKPPSAELREDQKDEDSLPPYDDLDTILRGLVDFELSVEEICDQGYDRDVVKRIEHLLYISEYKRRQSAPGPKIGPRNFGRDRRYPITSGWRDV